MRAMVSRRPVLAYLAALAAIAGVLAYWATALSPGKWRTPADADFDATLLAAVVVGSAVAVYACSPPRWLKALGIVASLALVAASGWIVVLMGSAGPAG
jgi:hypothetical protein